LGDNKLNASDTQLLLFLLGNFFNDVKKLHLLTPRERVAARKSISIAVKKMRNNETRFTAKEIVFMCFVVDSEIERVETAFSGSLHGSNENELKLLSSLHRISNALGAIRNTLQIVRN
jgi:hypothetical protein